jgi:hypothetical protein
MKTEQEIIKRINELEIEKLKLIGRLELLEEQKETKKPQEKVEVTEPSGLN